MGNGNNEPVAFTRGDSNRLCVIETQQKQSHDKIDKLTSKLNTYLAAHDREHDHVNDRVGKNSRFRRGATKVMLWVFTSSAGVGLLAAGARAMGWLN